MPPTQAGFTYGHITWNLHRRNTKNAYQYASPLCEDSSSNHQKNHDHVLSCPREMRNKNNKYSIPPFVPLAHSKWALPPRHQPPQNYHPTTSVIISSSNTTPRHTKTCPPNKPSCIKPSVKSPTSSSTTETTGTNFAPRQPMPRGRPIKLPTCPKNHRSTRLPKTKDSLPNRYSRKIHTALCFSPSNMLTSGGCTRSFLLDGRRDRPFSRPHGLGQTVRHRTSLHLPCPRILCCL